MPTDGRRDERDRTPPSCPEVAGRPRGRTPPAISVVVATRDRPQALERCLTALTWQSARSLEIVVVDDNSADPQAVRAVVASALLAADGARAAHIVAGTGEGPAAARNLGAEVAIGAVVCFTDDDCVPAPRWAQRLAAACVGAGAGAAAGLTVADPAAGRAAAASQLLTHTLQLSSLDRRWNTLGFAPTCNLACRDDVLREHRFDESFPLAAGEDREWCARLRAAGIPLAFVPEARVEHRPSMGLRGLLRQQRRYGRGAVRFWNSGDDAGPSNRAFYERLLREALRAGPVTAAHVALAQAAVATGALLEARADRSLPNR